MSDAPDQDWMPANAGQITPLPLVPETMTMNLNWPSSVFSLGSDAGSNSSPSIVESNSGVGGGSLSMNLDLSPAGPPVSSDEPFLFGSNPGDLVPLPNNNSGVYMSPSTGLVYAADTSASGYTALLPDNLPNNVGGFYDPATGAQYDSNYVETVTITGGPPEGAYGTNFSPSLPGWHDYRITDVAIPAYLHYSAPQALALFHKYGVPGNPGVTVVSGQRYLVSDPLTGLPAGLVVTTVDNGGYTVTNTTVPDEHILDNGEIDRTLSENSDGSWSVTTHGFGNNVIPGFNVLNQYYGPVVFSTLDAEMTAGAQNGDVIVTPEGQVL
jgi:hypothetical protein